MCGGGSDAHADFHPSDADGILIRVVNSPQRVEISTDRAWRMEAKVNLSCFWRSDQVIRYDRELA